MALGAFSGLGVAWLIGLAMQAAAAQQITTPAAQAVAIDLSPRGLRFSTSDGYAFRIRPIMQVDAAVYLHDARATRPNTLQMRRVRLIIDGRLGEFGAIYLQPDFGRGRVTILDSYVELMPKSWLGIRAGKFKTPVGLERVLAVAALVMPEPTFPTTLSPGRDVGAQLQGTIGRGLLSYAAGVFNGVADGATGDLDDADEKDFGARVFSEPFAGSRNRFVRGVGVGVGASAGYQHGTYGEAGRFSPTPNLSTLRSVGGTPYFAFASSGDYAGTVIAAGENRRFDPQGWYFAGPFGLLAEYVQTRHRVKRAGQRAEIRFDAWSATASWIVTGEAASPLGTAPAKPLGEGVGAWQIAVTAGRLLVGSAAFPFYADPAKSARAARAWGVGLNWYANETLRVTAAFEKTRFEPAAPVRSVRPDEEFLLARLQYGFL